MKVKLEHYTPLHILVQAIRTCYDSGERSDNLGTKDIKLIDTIISNGHTSTLEHINFSFYIEGFSRLCLQELSRHRIASFSVKSTRYTLKELKDEKPFIKRERLQNLDRTKLIFDYKRASKYIKLLDIADIDNASVEALENIRMLISEGKHPLDKIKYCLPECYLTNEMLTINLRSLRNFLDLRTNNRAHFEIRELANKIAKALPEDYQFLIKDCVHG